jgi:CRISPR/Cas system-associated exonuclease Cas4 (RecB family)
LNSYYSAETGDGCYHSFNLAYIHGDRGESNYFSEFGTLVHEVTEKIHKKELFGWDVDDELKKGLASFTYRAPFFNMKKSYETSLFKYFDEFDELFKDYQIQQAEEEKLFLVDDIKIRGFPDLIGQHRRYGMFIGDYKTSKVYEGEKLNTMIMQMYLYSIPFFNEYGYYPDHLVYIYPREKINREYAYRFDMKELERTKQWVRDTVRKIETHGDQWEPRCKKVNGDVDFYANQLCSHRNLCEFKSCFANSNPFGE